MIVGEGAVLRRHQAALAVVAVGVSLALPCDVLHGAIGVIIRPKNFSPTLFSAPHLMPFIGVSDPVFLLEIAGVVVGKIIVDLFGGRGPSISNGLTQAACQIVGETLGSLRVYLVCDACAVAVNRLFLADQPARRIVGAAD